MVVEERKVSNKMKFLLCNIAFILLLTISIVSCTSTYFTSSNEIHVKLLYNAGVMIETEETRIYIDPFDLPTNYSDYPADAILITHEHGDHYDPTSIDIISDENTSFYFPAIMITEAFQYGATSVRPEDTFAINNINVRCFYMYTEPGHPLENNYTSYIIDIGGFTLFHAGDSWKIDEYEQLTDEIDLVLLPIGPGCQTMTGVDVVGVIATIDPSYFIPIHYTVDGKESFIAQYQISVENAGCELIDLEYYASYYFDQPESTDDTSSSTTTENGSNAPGFSLIAAISAGAYLLIKRTKKQKDK